MSVGPNIPSGPSKKRKKQKSIDLGASYPVRVNTNKANGVALFSVTQNSMGLHGSCVFNIMLNTPKGTVTLRLDTNDGMYIDGISAYMMNSKKVDIMSEITTIQSGMANIIGNKEVFISGAEKTSIASQKEIFISAIEKLASFGKEITIRAIRRIGIVSQALLSITAGSKIAMKAPFVTIDGRVIIGKQPVGVARIGDKVLVTGGPGGPYIGTIISGSNQTLVS